MAELEASQSDAAVKAQGLYNKVLHWNVVLGLLCAVEKTEELEVLNVSLLVRTQSVDSVLSAVESVKDTYEF